MTHVRSNEFFVRENRPDLYIHSENEQWVQPSITHYDFYLDGQVMYGSISKSATSSGTIALYCEAGQQPLILPDEKTKAWEDLSDEELAILYEETADEDQMLANLGFDHYAQLLELEEESV